MKIRKQAAVVAAIVMAFGLAASFTACKDETDAPCNHTITKIAQKDADCKNEGNFEHYKCTECGELFSDGDGLNIISVEKITITKRPHTAQFQDETVGKYKNFYYCSSCGGYFTDKTCSTEIAYSELEDSSVKPVKLPDLSDYGNILVTKSISPSSDFDDISSDFTVRMFVGWTNKDGKGISEFPEAAKVQTNYNLNRTETLNGDGWYNFGIGYNTKGLTYKRLQSGSVESAKTEYTTLFRKNGGIYVRIVRKGFNVSFYFEDKNGKPRFIDGNDEFKGSGTLIRLAANKAEGADGWLPFVKNAAICIGVGNPRCVF